MEFKELIESRRSVRSFESGKKITMKELYSVIDAAIQAPSWKNTQTARYYAIWADETVLEFSQRCLPAFNQKSSQGACYIVTTYVKDIAGFDKATGQPDNEIGNGWGMYDLGFHDAYLILAAKEMGFDTLVMGIRDSEEIRNMLWIPENEEIVSVIAIGYGAVAPTKPKRKTPDDILTIY